MTCNLRIVTYNCQWFNCNIEFINQLLETCDVVYLQETLLNDILQFQLYNLNDDFIPTHVSAVRNSNMFVGRPHGGLDILWRKTLYIQFFLVEINNYRILGLKLECLNISNYLLNVHLPCHYHNVYSLIEYKSIQYLISRMSVHVKLMTK